MEARRILFICIRRFALCAGLARVKMPNETYRCYLVEKTGRSVEGVCDCRPGCRQPHLKPIYRRMDTGAELQTYPWNFPIGAMWIEMHKPGECLYWDNCDGLHVHIRVPGGLYWDVDSRASNCTKKEDKLHRCWVRHGIIPNLTVDKAGLTCSAGAGSIQTENWHGFLRGGILTP